MVEADLVHLISNSGCSEWVVEVSPGKKVVGTLMAYCANVNIELREDKGLGDEIRLWPKIAAVEFNNQEPSQSSAVRNR